jgi:hypothetical protein
MSNQEKNNGKFYKDLDYDSSPGWLEVFSWLTVMSVGKSVIRPVS